MNALTLYTEIQSANSAGRLYSDPSRDDTQSNDALELLIGEGLIEAGELDGVAGWRVVLADE